MTMPKTYMAKANKQHEKGLQRFFMDTPENGMKFTGDMAEFWTKMSDTARLFQAQGATLASDLRFHIKGGLAIQRRVETWVKAAIDAGEFEYARRSINNVITALISEGVLSDKGRLVVHADGTVNADVKKRERAAVKASTVDAGVARMRQSVATKSGKPKNIKGTADRRDDAITVIKALMATYEIAVADLS